ncbi:hypothetical protein V3C99_008498 [Haemonchus contortus]
MSNQQHVDERGANLSLSSNSSSTKCYSKKPGFDHTNTDQGKRQLEVRERVNRLVLCKQIKILFIPNKEKRPLKELVNKFLNEVVKYDVKQDPSPLSWVRAAGSVGEATNFRAEMSSLF